MEATNTLLSGPATNIPNEHVYKIYQLNQERNVARIIIFNGNKDTNLTLTDWFSEIELADIELHQTQVVFSDDIIRYDDTIRTIKRKVLGHMDRNTVSYPELYLFAKTSLHVDLFNIYNTITQNNKIEFKSNMLAQLLHNMRIAPDVIENIPELDTYSYETLFKYLPIDNTKLDVSIPIGQQFSSYRDLLYPANPYDNISSVEMPFKQTAENNLITFEKDLLLNYGPTVRNTLYVCLVDDVLQYTESIGLDDKYITELYFPILATRNVYTKEEIANVRQELIVDDKEVSEDDTIRQYNADIDALYKIHYLRTSELPNLKKGIHEVDMIMHPDAPTILPLEVIFKNIHATVDVPFVKYNPAPRQENLYRMYCNKMSKGGKKIPFLKKQQITNLSKYGSSREIFLFVNATCNNMPTDLYLTISHNGNIRVKCSLAKSVTTDTLNNFLKTSINTIIERFNHFLKQTGYKMNTFVDIEHPLLEIQNIEYSFEIGSVINNINFNKHLNCLTNLFEIIEHSSSGPLVLNYKRVDNYKKMTSIQSMITKIYQTTNSERSVIEALVLNFNMTEEQSLMEVAKYLNDFNQINGRYVNKSFDILENQGFNALLRSSQTENTMTLVMTNIDNIGYIQVLDIYLDSLFRIMTIPDGTGVSRDEIAELCSKKRKVITADEEDNVIVPSVNKITVLEDTDGDLLDEEDEEGIIFFDEEDEEDEEDGYNTDDTDAQEPHLNEPFNDKRLYKPCIKHPKSPDARQTFLNEDLQEKRIYKLPFKSLTPEQAQKNYAQRNHFCYDSVALSDYIVHKMTTIMNPDLSDTLFARTTKYDPKCKRNINVYMSTKKWQIGKAEERYLSFTDYEFGDLLTLIAHFPEVFTGVIKNPAWDQPDLISLQPQMTEYFTPNILCNALHYFKGYHDILVLTRGGEALNNPKIRQQIEAISGGEYVNPFAGTEFDRPDENAEEVSYFTSAWNTIKTLGYTLYSSVISFTVNAFDFMKSHFAKLQVFYSVLCAGAFVWVASTLFATGGWLATLSSPAVRAGTVNLLTQALNSKILLSVFNSATGFVNTSNDFVQDVTSNRLQTWSQWSLSWTPWVWSKVTGIPFDKCLNIFTKMGNLMWKYGPTKLFALWSLVGIIYAAGVILKEAGTVITFTPYAPAGPVLAIIGSMTEGLASFLRELTPVFSYLMFAFELFQYFVANAASITTFVSTIFTGEMTPIDAVITFKYIPKMLCSWSMPADSKLLTHCNKFAFIIEQSAWLAVISGFVLDVMFDVLFFTGLGGSPGRCGKIVGSFKTSRDEAIAQAEKDGADGWYGWFFGGKTTEEKEQMARDRVFGKQFRDTHQNSDTVSGRLGGLLNRSDKSAPPAYPTTDSYAYVQQERKATYTQWVKE